MYPPGEDMKRTQPVTDVDGVNRTELTSRTNEAQKQEKLKRRTEDEHETVNTAVDVVQFSEHHVSIYLDYSQF